MVGRRSLKPFMSVRFALPELYFQRDGLMVSRLLREQEFASLTLVTLTEVDMNQQLVC